ncbi:hypothetical protein EFA69_19240 [Rufibacter immobilis]|uniref:L,D-TPase catalytic domain-containing protein n=1 Tax=Rufibacter immobilis TaxID=1348778 RepID=A0A3M9MRN3_9BACT|nr:L,D-transpeptidase family protein [Rufibacter immobilis]RNI28204.1 hypothetical protein EFA69_19240 [Rufibacter immobilis]
MRRWFYLWLAFFGFWWASGAVQAQTSTFAPARQVELLQEARQRFLSLAKSNQWQPVDKHLCLVACEKAPEVPGLKVLLQLTGDLPAHVSEKDSLFDDTLIEAVRRFQRRHGLIPDGVVGPQTLEALNVSPAQRLAQIELNLKRWQLALAQPAQRMVFVNLPDFSLHLLNETGQPVWRTNVIIGQTNKDFQTIPMESQITYLVLNPTWTVPQSILRREIIPLLKHDPNYLTRNRMLVYRQDGAQRVQVSPKELFSNPAGVAKGIYWVVQQPGPTNSLGKIKFMFPNLHDIYLHDTPNRTLFAHPVRAYSHGCVRVQNPELLGSYLLNPDWAETGKSSPLLKDNSLNKKITLPAPVAVTLAYYTAWVDEKGDLQFRNDLYGIDKQERRRLDISLDTLH